MKFNKTILAFVLASLSFHAAATLYGTGGNGLSGGVSLKF